jgi:Flp pilus assembly protein TadG
MLTTLIALLMPVLILMLALVINTGHLVHCKMQLQITADRAVYAGAAREAALMNRMVAQNRMIREKYQNLKQELEHSTKKDESQARARVQTVNAENHALWAEMESWNRAGLEAALQVTTAVARANYPRASVAALVPAGPMLRLDDRWETPQYQVMHFDHMTGPIFVDPTGHEEGREKILTYVVKDPNGRAAWAAQLSAPLPEGFMTHTLQSLLPRALTLRAISAAQPHGGSIRDGREYHVSFVPIARVVRGAAHGH